MNSPLSQGAEPVATVLEVWLEMCCDTPEFVSNYNRLKGTALRFTLPARAPIVQMVDKACGFAPILGNDEAEQEAFFEHCKELLLAWPGLDDPRNFREVDALRHHLSLAVPMETK